MKKDRFNKVRQLQERLHELNFEPMTWEWADKFFDLIVEAMSVLNDREFVDLLKSEEHDQAFIKAIFTLKPLQEHLSTKNVEWYTAFKILFKSWDDLETDWEFLLKKTKK